MKNISKVLISNHGEIACQVLRTLDRLGIPVWWFITLPETIELMGNKVAARTFCIENDFPLAPSVTEADAGKDFAEHACGIGVPLLIKAAAAGKGTS